MIVYAILLENEKFFLYPSIKDDKDSLFLEVELLQEFVTVNKPILIIESYYIWDIKEVDIYVKKYMKERGIQNVRGGSYCEVDLPEYKLKALENEFIMTKENVLHTASIIDFIIEIYKNISEAEKEAELLILKKRLNEYQEIKGNLNYYSKLSNNEKLDRSFLPTLEWLLSYINEENIIDIKNKEIRPLYNDAMLKLQQLSKLFFERFPDYDFLPSLNYCRPDVVFDKIFIHKRYLYDWEHTIETAKEVYSKFELMYYKMINYLEELEFDLTTFSENFEEESVLAIKYIDNIL